MAAAHVPLSAIGRAGNPIGVEGAKALADAQARLLQQHQEQQRFERPQLAAQPPEVILQGFCRQRLTPVPTACACSHVVMRIRACAHRLPDHSFRGTFARKANNLRLRGA